MIIEAFKHRRTLASVQAVSSHNDYAAERGVLLQVVIRFEPARAIKSTNSHDVYEGRIRKNYEPSLFFRLKKTRVLPTPGQGPTVMIRASSSEAVQIDVQGWSGTITSIDTINIQDCPSRCPSFLLSGRLSLRPLGLPD